MAKADKTVYLKTDDEVELIRESSLLVGKTLAEVAKLIRPGITTRELDTVAESFIRDHGAEPGFKGLGNYPNTLCTSVNEAVVHGLPTDIPLEPGDIVSVDCGVKKNGFFGDSAFTFAIGELSDDVKKLLRVTRECLEIGIANAVIGKRVGDISWAIQNHAEKHGYGVVRELVGHGVGRNLHEAPEVPNFGKRGTGPVMRSGLVIAIEPMINMGTKNVKHQKDGWTVSTADRKPSAHFEHTVAVRNGKAEVLSSFEWIEQALGLSVDIRDKMINGQTKIN
ncbi:MAG: type I methionyl aminopeptidase [Flavobacteriales bacterium]|nr:type I methionyl aminopeptidase [Flavobacteriales bacterium]